MLQGMACVCVRSWRGGLGIGVKTLNPKTPKPAATGCAAPALSSALLSVANIHVDLSVVGATIRLHAELSAAELSKTCVAGLFVLCWSLLFC